MIKHRKKQNDNGCEHPLVLVTGATGYIGGRLIPRLLEMGYRVRCLVRDPIRLQGRPWQDAVEIVAGDVLQPESLVAALQGVEAACTSIHSMAGGADFHERDVIAATQISILFRTAGVKRIIFLGRAGRILPALSERLAPVSRAAMPCARLACRSPPRRGDRRLRRPLSFEMIRYLTGTSARDNLPTLGLHPHPAHRHPGGAGLSGGGFGGSRKQRTHHQNGGADVVTYGEMMLIYAEVRGLKRWMIQVPPSAPPLLLWVNLVTPIPRGHRPPADRRSAQRKCGTRQQRPHTLPHIQPVGYRTAVERALTPAECGPSGKCVERCPSTSQGDVPPVTLTVQEGMVLEHRQRVVPASRPPISTPSSRGLGQAGLVCHELGLGDSRAGGQADRGRGSAPLGRKRGAGGGNAWISGGWKQWSRITCCVCEPR